MVCTFCDRSGGDICDYRMWQKTDTNDKPVDAYMIACTGAACRKRIDDDQALFIEVPWGVGGPGKFMLLCGDCTHRDGFSCKHPNLKSNGGTGLEVKFSNLPIFNSFICGPDDCKTMPAPASWCVGNPSDD
jgi:hypothetical protein